MAAAVVPVAGDLIKKGQAMCGIVGSVGPWTARESQAHLASSLALLAHRGPDDHGALTTRIGNRAVDLGQTRLSIIDLTPGGHQPMTSDDGRFTLTFNGEIYNYRELRRQLIQREHRFHSDSDTEVLLRAWMEWGPACLTRMTGMWAFGVLDRESRTLTCVRDAFGIKPLFYRCSGDDFTFASELPALREMGRLPVVANQQRMYEYLVWGAYDVGVETFVSGVCQLPPGHLVEIDLTRVNLAASPRRWWWPSITERQVSLNDAAEEMRELFLQSVRWHLRSDVAIGAALSGGVDSSSIVCAMRHLEPSLDIHAFCFVPTGHPLSEESWMSRVGAKAHATIHEVSPSASDLVQDLDRMILTQGEPFSSTSIYAQFRVFQLARDCGVTVTLEGQGADELLAGYRGYPGPRIASLMGSGHLIRAAAFAKGWRRWPDRPIKSLARESAESVLPRWSRRSITHFGGRLMMPPWVSAATCADMGIDITIPVPAEGPPVRGRRLAQRLRHDMTAGGLASLLRHSDRNSMHWSIESRVPFLTVDLAEFCLGLPEDYLISGKGETKHVFRRAMQGIVPEQILARRDKVGFETPERDWLAPLVPVLRDWLSGLDGIPFIVPDKARQHVREVLDGSRGFDRSAWRLINAARWMQISG